MTFDEFDTHYENGCFMDEYAEYLMKNPDGERLICNGDTLILAMEDGHLYEDFRAEIVKTL